MVKVIDINIPDLLYNIDALIHKRMDVSGGEDPLKAYNIRTDESPLDRSILLRMTDNRDATVRMILQAYLRPAGPRCVTNEETEADDSYMYSICMPCTWPDALLKPLSTKIHDYIVTGALYDYYMSTDPSLARGIDSTIMEEEIRSMIKTRTGKIRRPLQPF